VNVPTEVANAIGLINRTPPDNPFARNVKICDLRHNMQTERINQLNGKDLKRLQKYHEAIQFLLSLDDERIWK
jgi:hypothetical protein